MPADNDRSRRDVQNAQKQIGVLRTPGPETTRRPGSRTIHGSQRSALEIFNRQYAEWDGKEFDDDYSILTDAQARAIRRKIRKALYASDGDFQLRKGTITYREAVKKHGFKLNSLRKKLDSAFDLLAMAEASWASDLFIQEVFKTDRTYKPARSNWVHPRNRSTNGSGQHEGNQHPRIFRARNVRNTGPMVSNHSDRIEPSSSTCRKVRMNGRGASVGRGTYVSKGLSSGRREALSQGQNLEEGEENGANESSGKTTPAVSPLPRAPGKRRRLRRVIESDEEEEKVENDDDDEEEQLLQKLEEIRKKRARRNEH